MGAFEGWIDGLLGRVFFRGFGGFWRFGRGCFFWIGIRFWMVVVADGVGGFVFAVVVIAIGRFGFGVGFGGGISGCWFGFIGGRHRGHDKNRIYCVVC